MPLPGRRDPLETWFRLEPVEDLEGSSSSAAASGVRPWATSHSSCLQHFAQNLHPSRFSALQFGQTIGLLKSLLRRPRIRLRDQAPGLCLGGLDFLVISKEPGGWAYRCVTFDGRGGARVP